ncbi:hypothetical protein JD844_016073 [Phrynosoma platyrhinos]|uniref:SCP domain-containing protein n=1 Tax=Phrynosoma platyrhinos TaxID=52577 RepID=A0ABQ7SJW8_PHRPL|nr:hypothetical protein JD844_016073 [Phrynosoma platyrhinos]
MIAISAIGGALLISIFYNTSAIELPNSTDTFLSANNYTSAEAALNTQLDSTSLPKTRRKRYISQNDMIAILDYHNQVRGKVFPPASNMEYMCKESCMTDFEFHFHAEQPKYAASSFIK